MDKAGLRSHVCLFHWSKLSLKHPVRFRVSSLMRMLENLSKWIYTCIMSEVHQLHYSSATVARKRTHQCREEKAAESWARLRKGLLTSLIESCSHPAELQCYMCSTESSQVYCQDCGGYMCIECAQKLHTNMNVFHIPVMWKVSIDPLQLHNVLRKSLHTSEYVPPSLCTTTMAV